MYNFGGLMNLYELLKTETDKLNLPPIEVSEYAPETLADVVAHYNATGKIKVWAGASEGTIWGPAAGNWLFRGWHDYCHVLSLGEFNAAGEALVCYVQKSQTESSFMHKALQIEIMGQLEYQIEIGHFPVDQLQFFINKIKVLK